MTYSERKALNKKHLFNPEVGDYWREYCSPVLVVLEVLETSIVFCKTKKYPREGYWDWDLDVIHDLSPEDFRGFLSYDDPVSGTCAIVYPRNEMRTVKEAMEM